MTLRLADYLKWGPRDESKQDRGLSSARLLSRLSTETISCMSRSSSAFFVLVDTEATRRTIILPNNQHQKPRHTVKTLPLNIGRPPSVTVLSPNTVELVITYRNRRPGKTCIKTARGTPSCQHEEKTFATSLVSAVSDFSWYQLLGALVMINAQLFRALVNAGPNNAQIIGADNGGPRADIDHIITQLFS